MCMLVNISQVTVIKRAKIFSSLQLENFILMATFLYIYVYIYIYFSKNSCSKNQCVSRITSDSILSFKILWISSLQSFFFFFSFTVLRVESPLRSIKSNRYNSLHIGMFCQLYWLQRKFTAGLRLYFAGMVFLLFL